MKPMQCDFASSTQKSFNTGRLSGIFFTWQKWLFWFKLFILYLKKVNFLVQTSLPKITCLLYKSDNFGSTLFRPKVTFFAKGYPSLDWQHCWGRSGAPPNMCRWHFLHLIQVLQILCGFKAFSCPIWYGGEGHFTRDCDKWTISANTRHEHWKVCSSHLGVSLIRAIVGNLKFNCYAAKILYNHIDPWIIPF